MQWLYSMTTQLKKLETDIKLLLFVCVYLLNFWRKKINFKFIYR
jgi:hypothetical protein